MDAKICLIYSTFGKVEDAKKVGKKLVEERYAACVNVIPEIYSFYWWKGKLEDDKESLLIAKTTMDRADDAVRKIKDMHPYELPAILVIPLSKAPKEFEDYVRDEVKS